MWSRKKSQQALQVLWRYGLPHLTVLIPGIAATIGVVLLRLAMPWPLRGIVELVFQDSNRKNAFLLDMLPARGDPALWLGGAYLLLAAGAGLCELVQRVAMKRFAAQTVHDMRGAAVQGTLSRRTGGGAPAELITRIIGDSARIKAGLSGMLVHGFQNGLLYLGVSILLVVVSPQLAVFFIGAGALAVLIGFRAAAPVAASANRHRRKESAYAIAIQEAIEAGTGNSIDSRLNIASARKDVETTKLVSLSTLAVHIALAATLAGGLWFGCTRAMAGMLQPGDLFIFVAYILTVHRRMVQVGRQFARGGKVLACARRIGRLIPDDSIAGSPAKACGRLMSVIRLEGVRLDSLRGRANKPRLSCINLTIKAGAKVAVTGPMGAGKTSLLRVLAGIEPPSKGTIYWDDQPLTDWDWLLREQVNYLPDCPVFSPQPVWRILGLPGPDAELPSQAALMFEALGINKLLARLPKGMRQKVASAMISRQEARALSQASMLMSSCSVWVMDDVFGGPDKKKKLHRRLEEIFARADERTVVVGLPVSGPFELFDRVVVLRRGRIYFDGTPGEWMEMRKCRP